MELQPIFRGIRDEGTRGFTLIELVVVLALIALISAFLMYVNIPGLQRFSCVQEAYAAKQTLEFARHTAQTSRKDVDHRSGVTFMGGSGARAGGPGQVSLGSISTCQKIIEINDEGAIL